MPAYFTCFNHKYPLVCVEGDPKFKKNILGRVCRVETPCRCPECGMELIYTIHIKNYRKGKLK